MRQAFLVLIGLAGALNGQPTATPSAPTFEAASLKPSDANSPLGWTGGPETRDPGQYSYGQATPLALILTAYHVNLFQVSSKFPLDRQHFDLVAKIPPGATKAEFRLMLQTLLQDRFHLKAHIESKEFPAYELAVAKTGLKLKEAQVTSHAAAPRLSSTLSNGGDGVLVRVTSQQEPISAFAQLIHSPENLPVVDKTGLTGKYDFTLEYTYAPLGAAPTSAQLSETPDVFHALRQLGLELIPRKLPFDVVVVDSIDKTPTEN